MIKWISIVDNPPEEFQDILAADLDCGEEALIMHCFVHDKKIISYSYEQEIKATHYVPTKIFIQ